MIASNPESYRNSLILSCKIYRYQDFVYSVYSRPQSLRYVWSCALNLVPMAFSSHGNEVDDGRRNTRNALLIAAESAGARFQ